MHARDQQLLDVVEDLCLFASLLFVVGPRDRADTLLEQAADLLAHRAQVVALSRLRVGETRLAASSESVPGVWVSRWMN